MAQSQVSIDYHRSFRRTVVWRWSKDRKTRKGERPNTTRTDVVNLYHARQKGLADRIAVKRILANLHGNGNVDVQYVDLLGIEES